MIMIKKMPYLFAYTVAELFLQQIKLELVKSLQDRGFRLIDEHFCQNGSC